MACSAEFCRIMGGVESKDTDSSGRHGSGAVADVHGTSAARVGTHTGGAHRPAQLRKDGSAEFCGMILQNLGMQARAWRVWWRAAPALARCAKSVRTRPRPRTQRSGSGARLGR